MPRARGEDVGQTLTPVKDESPAFARLLLRFGGRSHHVPGQLLEIGAVIGAVAGADGVRGPSACDVFNVRAGIALEALFFRCQS